MNCSANPDFSTELSLKKRIFILFLEDLTSAGRLANPDRLLRHQMQCVDLQEIDGLSPMPNLAGYIGDSEARKKPIEMKLTYAAICHINCGQEKRMTGMALIQNVVELNGEGTDERLLELYHAARHVPYLQAAPR